MDRLTYSGKCVRYGEVWFADEAPPHLADIVLARQCLRPLPAGRCSEFWSIEIDLGKAPEALLEAMDKNTRYEIRRAEKRDGLTCDFWPRPGAEIQGTFLDFYNGAAATGERERIRAEVLRRYTEAGMLGLSRVAQDGRDLAWHAYILAENRARLWLSGSAQDGDRALIGRSNRYLHWRDMEALRNLGTGIYDFGGWYQGSSDKKLLSINQFKEQFGGTRVCHHDCVVPQSLRGKLYLRVQAMLNRLRG
jgi:hypothetical protein